MKDSPTEQIGFDDNSVAHGILISITVTLILAFILASVSYMVFKADERAEVVQEQQLKQEHYQQEA